MPLRRTRLTPAMRGVGASAGHGVSSVRIREVAVAEREVGVHLAQMEVRRDRALLDDERPPSLRPATPDADSRWPKLVLTEPMRSGPRARVRRRAPSPKRLDLDGVAERRPGAVRTRGSSTSSGVSPARASASRISACCACPLGTVSPLLAPSWLIARAADHATMRSAVAQRVVEALQHDHAAPLAAHEAVGRSVERGAAPVRRDHARLADHERVSGDRITFTPPATIRSRFAGAQALAGEVDGDQRRRAGACRGRASARAVRAGRRCGRPRS